MVMAFAQNQFAITPTFLQNKIYKFKVKNSEINETNSITEKTDMEYQMDVKISAILKDGYGLILSYKIQKISDSTMLSIFKAFEKIQYPILLNKKGNFIKLVEPKKLLQKTQYIFDSFMHIEALKMPAEKRDSTERLMKMFGKMFLTEDILESNLEEILPVFMFNGESFDLNTPESYSVKINNGVGGPDFPGMMEVMYSGNDGKGNKRLDTKVILDSANTAKAIKATKDTLNSRAKQMGLNKPDLSSLNRLTYTETAHYLYSSVDKWPIQYTYIRNYQFGLSRKYKYYLITRIP